MRRVLVIAETEFLALIRTKAFIIGILLVPVMMGLFIAFMSYAEDHIDVTDRTIAVIDDTGVLFPSLQKAAEAHNLDAGEGESKTEPHYRLEQIATGQASRDEQLVGLSERIRAKQLFAVIEIPPNILEPPPVRTEKEKKERRLKNDGKDDDERTFRFYTDTSTAGPVVSWLADAVNTAIAERRFASAGLDQTRIKQLTARASLTRYGLVERAADGSTASAKEMDEVQRFGIPMFVLVLMFMSVMTGAMHLLNAIIEEKMSKISEVLLGSVTAVELLSGKLLGVVAVSILLTFVYLAGGIYALVSMGRPDLIDPVLIGWFLVFMVCAAMMFGAIFLAIGSACSDLKDSQSMIQPAMMLILLAYLGSFVVMRAPESGLSVGLSMFPTITPFAMMLRLAMPPGPPLWQVFLSVVILMATTAAIVWAAGRIFRVGLLMQGKPPNIPELLKWVWR